MTCVISLAGNTVAWNDTTYTLANIQNHACIAITCTSWETRLSSRLAAIYVVVYLRTHANGRILVLNEYSVIRNRREIILRQFYLTEIGVGKSTWAQCTNLVR